MNRIHFLYYFEVFPVNSYQVSFGRREGLMLICYLKENLGSVFAKFND